MSKDSLEVKTLKEVQKELKRFSKKLKKAIKAKTEDRYSCRDFAASKRGAMDLKIELTKLTQFSKHSDEYYRNLRARETAKTERV